MPISNRAAGSKQSKAPASAPRAKQSTRAAAAARAHRAEPSMRARPRSIMPVTTEQRRQMIEERAYLIAERRGFERGHDVEDWLAAEREIDSRLGARARAKGKTAGALGVRALSQLKQRLEDRQARLLTEVRALRAEAEDHPYAELAGAVADAADAASADVMIDTENALVSKHILELRDIAAALRRVAAGTYGSCADCGQDIGAERLAIHPTAKRCVLCQAVRERSYAHAPTPVV